MRLPLVQLCLCTGLLAGCAGGSGIKPSETIDERTGVTVGALQSPIELVESQPNAIANPNQRPTFGYLGPVEWDQSGDLSYALWIHVAPGNDRQVADIRAPGAVTLRLDGTPVVLAAISPPTIGGNPYRAVVSWGQTSYFAIDVALLKRMAASARLVLELKGADQPTVEFTPTHETRDTLTKFDHSRGITDD